MKKLLFSALIVMSTLTCLAPPERALSVKSTIKETISNDKQVVATTDCGKPPNPIPASRR